MPKKRGGENSASRGKTANGTANVGYEAKLWLAADNSTRMEPIQRGHVTVAKVLVPPCPLRNAMTRIVSPLSELIIANRTNSSTLATMRNTLLPKLLSGELTSSAYE